jgi:hypothetical protein
MDAYTLSLIIDSVIPRRLIDTGSRIIRFLKIMPTVFSTIMFYMKDELNYTAV